MGISLPKSIRHRPSAAPAAPPRASLKVSVFSLVAAQNNLARRSRIVGVQGIDIAEAVSSVTRNLQYASVNFDQAHN